MSRQGAVARRRTGCWAGIENRHPSIHPGVKPEGKWNLRVGQDGEVELTVRLKDMSEPDCGSELDRGKEGMKAYLPSEDRTIRKTARRKG